MIAEESCPISGEYFGTIPDAVGLCAKLYSDCRHPHKLFYTVSNCFNDSEIYQGKNKIRHNPMERPRNVIQDAKKIE